MGRVPAHVKHMRERAAFDQRGPTRGPEGVTEAHLQARVEYAQATVADFVRSRARGGTIVWSGNEVSGVVLSDIRPEPFTVRELVELGLI